MRRLILFCLSLSVFSSPVLAQDSKPLTDSEVKKMLESVQAMRKKMRGRYASVYRRAVKDFQAAAKSPTDAYQFYLKCYQKKYSDQGKAASAFRSWKEGKEEELKSIHFQTGLQMQLQYLILALKAGLAETDEDYKKMIPTILSFEKKIASQDGRVFERLDGNTLSSIFAETYKLDDVLVLDNWSDNPTDIGSVFETSILPYYREKQKDPRLLSAWKSRIELTKAIMAQRKKAADAKLRKRLRDAARRGNRDKVDPRRTTSLSDSNDKFEKFETEGLPELKWEMGMDLAEHGFESEAYNGMLEVLKSGEKHPKVMDWISQLDEILNAKLEGRDPMLDKSKK